MGIFSWISTTARKSQAAALIQTLFEVHQKMGMFELDPAASANKIVELTCSRHPVLSEQKLHSHLLAALCLQHGSVDTSLPAQLQDKCHSIGGSLLTGIIDGQKKGTIKLSHQEQELFQKALQLYLQLDERRPVIKLTEEPVIPDLENLVFTELDVRYLNELLVQIRQDTGVDASIDYVALAPNTSVAGILMKTKEGAALPVGSFVKSLELDKRVVTLRGFQGMRLPEAPEQFESFSEAVSFSRPYFLFMAGKLPN